MGNSRFSRLEKSWIMYDVGNSAFILLVSTLIPIYFNYLSEQSGISSINYLAYWGYAVSIATIAVAILGPILATIADTKNYKLPMFATSLVIGVIGCMTLGLWVSWVVFLVFFVLTKITYSISLIFYDGMIHDVTTPDRMDNVSSQGYGWGYIGSCVPFILCLALVLGSSRLGLSFEAAMLLSFIIVGAWWFITTIPLIKNYKQLHFVEREKHAISRSFGSLAEAIKDMKQDKKIMMFLIAYFFYIDGVYTIIEMATSYGKTLGLSSTGLLLALLVTQFVAFPCAILMGKLSVKIASEKLIAVCILAYTGIAVFAFFMSTQLHFWILAILVGVFQGGIQSLSRSYFAKIIPESKSCEYFGLMDICGKGASFIGTTLVSIVSQLTGNANLGVGVLTILFLIGLFLFIQSAFPEKTIATLLQKKEDVETSIDN